MPTNPVLYWLVVTLAVCWGSFILWKGLLLACAVVRLLRGGHFAAAPDWGREEEPDTETDWPAGRIGRR